MCSLSGSAGGPALWCELQPESCDELAAWSLPRASLIGSTKLADAVAEPKDCEDVWLQEDTSKPIEDTAGKDL